MKPKLTWADVSKMDIYGVFEIAPKSEQTIKKHGYKWSGFEFLNDMGHPCEYRITRNGEQLGMIKYYRGRVLSCYELVAA